MEPPHEWIDETDNDIGFNETEFNKCDSSFAVQYRTVELLVAVGMLAFGLFLCLAGYRAFRFSLWFAGFNFTFWCVLAICSRVENLPSGANWGAAFSVGTLAGFVTHLLPGVGTFLWGVYAGAIVTANILIVLVVAGVYRASPIESASICLLLGGSLCGALILTRHWSRQGLIIATSICGAILIVGGVDYLIEEWRLMAFLWHDVLKLAPEPQLKPSPCWYSFAIGATFFVFIPIGVFTQHMGTAKTYKKKVARVYVPPTVMVVSVYGTIRRTLGRNGEPQSRARVVDYFPPADSSQHNRSRAERSRNRARSHNQSRETSRQASAPNSSRQSRHSSRHERNRLLEQPRTNRHQAVNVVDECPPAYDDIFRVVRKPKPSKRSSVAHSNGHHQGH